MSDTHADNLTVVARGIVLAQWEECGGLLAHVAWDDSEYESVEEAPAFATEVTLVRYNPSDDYSYCYFK